jgi:thiol-disulfide isomerase/thioredoxin
MSLITAALLIALALPAGEGTVDLTSHRGRIVLLNFWASWCEPCRKELPGLERIHRQYGGRGLTTLGVSIDDAEERDAARRLVKQLGLSFPIRLDGTTDEMFALGLATSIPATAIFDRDGRRVFRIIGEAKEADIVARVEWLLSDRMAARPPDLVLPPAITAEHFAQHERGEKDEHDEHEEATASEGGSVVPT